MHKDLKITPGSRCKKPLELTRFIQDGDYTDKPNLDKAFEVSIVNGVDWISLAGLRDSTNSVLSYNSVSDEGSGVTFDSDIAKWFKSLGAIKDDKEFDLETIIKNYDKDKHIISLINTSLLQDYNESSSFFKQHWIVWVSNIEKIEDGVSQRVFSWGEGDRIVPKNPFHPNSKVMPYEKYKKHYRRSLIFTKIPYKLGECL